MSISVCFTCLICYLNEPTRLGFMIECIVRILFVVFRFVCWRSELEFKYQSCLCIRKLNIGVTMPLRGIIREKSEIREGSGNSSKKMREGVQMRHPGKSHIVPEQPSSSSRVPIEQSRWANLPPELLLDIIQRVEASETSWPSRRDVVTCASVCRSWRMVTKEVVRTPEQCGWITFPISLKQVFSVHPWVIFKVVFEFLNNHRSKF